MNCANYLLVILMECAVRDAVSHNAMCSVNVNIFLDSLFSKTNKIFKKQKQFSQHRGARAQTNAGLDVTCGLNISTHSRITKFVVFTSCHINTTQRKKVCQNLKTHIKTISLNIYFTIVKVYFWLKYIFHLSFYY